ncbi:hypothetical protein CLUG_00286 [Clavispora lusitaniae ATCC 42720]|uniref:Uncharacterized protein n=1 Tax=Clavispora lusitaniae (strain ATCC 42720) TaxID=306902 RepID=C4XWG3_CLAL4|nr:uncharacterized protein CLUG_00286 [Clavispora lusitaniae ATCC 42720]EEQ36163.1 hypothetical protein CLUG_00286 [Clavispora lusitaniae ATCC 42720]
MSKNFLIGAAVLGAGVYYYDQQVQPIFPRNAKNQVTLPHPSENVRKSAQDVEVKAKELGSQARDFGSSLKKTVSLSADEAKQKADSTIASIKESDTYNKWSEKLDSYAQDVKVAADEVENKPAPNRWAAKYIDFVNSLGQTKDEKLKELASSTSLRQQEIKNDLDYKSTSWSSWWSGKKSEAEAEKDRLANKAEAEKQGWLNWGSDKKREAEKKWESGKQQAEAEKQSWLNWGSKKADEAEKTAKDVKRDAEKEKDKWVNWGSAKADETKARAQEAHSDARASLDKQQREWSETVEAGRQRSIEEYYRAKRNLEELSKQATDDAHLSRAKKDLENALYNLKQYGANLVDQVTGRK